MRLGLRLAQGFVGSGRGSVGFLVFEFIGFVFHRIVYGSYWNFQVGFRMQLVDRVLI